MKLVFSGKRAAVMFHIQTVVDVRIRRWQLIGLRFEETSNGRMTKAGISARVDSANRHHLRVFTDRGDVSTENPRSSPAEFAPVRTVCVLREQASEAFRRNEYPYCSARYDSNSPASNAGMKDWQRSERNGLVPGV
jgi:hypothetical protein